MCRGEEGDRAKSSAVDWTGLAELILSSPLEFRREGGVNLDASENERADGDLYR
jgi:hypothetical protein